MSDEYFLRISASDAVEVIRVDQWGGTYTLAYGATVQEALERARLTIGRDLTIALKVLP